MASILLVEDDRAVRLTLKRALEKSGHSVVEAGTLAQARPHFELGTLDVAICDVGLPDGSGLEILELCRRVDDPPTVIVITGQDDLSLTITAIHGGASECLFKPLDLHELELAVGNAVDLRRDGRKVGRDAKVAGPVEAPGLVGRTAAMRTVAKQVALAAASDEPVLVTGESGTGKEVVARTIHRCSSRATKPMVALNCAALSPSLVESELFGSSKGSFTGAHADRQGRLEAAADGTLFLDEIGELALALQPKLLRVLQERSFERVGETQSRRFGARIIAATNRALLAEVREGRFRADLYYRLEVLSVRLPPLRDRIPDIDLLAARLLASIADPGRTVHQIDPEAMRHLHAYAWPGNVRELGNVLRRAVAMAPRGVITPGMIVTAIAARTLPTSARDGAVGSGPIESLFAVERRHIEHVLAACAWNKRAACRVLGISRPTLDRKIREFALGRAGIVGADGGGEADVEVHSDDTAPLTTDEDDEP